MDGDGDETVRTYDRIAAEWIANDDEPDFWLSEFELFRTCLPAGSVLEIGPGAGREAGMFIAAGYEYTAIEPSSELMRHAQARNPTGTFHNVRVQDMTFDNNTFNGFWAASSLLHVPKFHIIPTLEKLGRICPGYGFISVKDGPGSGWHGGRYFANYRREEFEDILYHVGMAPLYYSGRHLGWHAWVVAPGCPPLGTRNE